MAETTKIDLPVAGLKSFRSLTAEWWEINSKFAVVRGSTEKDEFSVRLDLEKRAFLDHTKSQKTDELLQSKANEISRLVWEVKRQQQREKGGHAAA